MLGVLSGVAVFVVNACGGATAPPAPAPTAPAVAAPSASAALVVTAPVPTVVAVVAAAPKCTDEPEQFDDARFTPKAWTPDQERDLSNDDRFLADHNGAATDAPERAELTLRRFTRARRFFDTNHWHDAAIAFREIAMDRTDPADGSSAATFYVETLDVLAAHTVPPRPSCFSDMADDVAVFVGIYCGTPALERDNHEECRSLRRLARDLGTREAEGIVARANATQDVALQRPLFLQAGARFLDLATQCCAESSKNTGPPLSEPACDELAYNAGIAFLGGGAVSQARAAQHLMLDPKNHMEKNPLIGKLAKAFATPRP